MKFHIPNSFLDDWQPARESWETDIDNGRMPASETEPIRRFLAKLEEAEAAAHQALHDLYNPRKTYRVYIDADEDDLRFLLQELTYRWEFNSPWYRNPFGNEYADRSVYLACDRALVKVRAALGME